jgi:hypothetical protein
VELPKLPGTEWLDLLHERGRSVPCRAGAKPIDLMETRGFELDRDTPRLARLALDSAPIDKMVKALTKAGTTEAWRSTAMARSWLLGIADQYEDSEPPAEIACALGRIQIAEDRARGGWSVKDSGGDE